MAERVALVLGGGGIKGLAHAGAWRAVLEAGVQVHDVIGTSVGALVGACIAGGLESERITALARALQKTDIVLLNRWAMLFNGIRQPSVFRSEPFEAYIGGVLPVSDWDDLQLPLNMNAVDLESGEECWFGHGARLEIPLARAIYASCALPVFYPPLLIDGHHYVDGGILNALPIDRAAARGADRIIAVDVGAGPKRDALDTVSKGLVAIHHRVTQMMGHARKKLLLENWRGPELIYVRPELDDYSTFDFASTEYFLAEGYRATRAALQGVTGQPKQEAV